MDLPAIFAAAKDAGTRWVIYEQDLCKRDVFESAQLSLDNLRKGGFA